MSRAVQPMLSLIIVLLIIFAIAMWTKMMLCILFFLTFINSENGFIITHGHRYVLFRQPYYHRHLLLHPHYYHGFNRPFNHIRYLLHRNCTCKGGCYSCQYKRVPYYFGCGMFKMKCEKGKEQGQENRNGTIVPASAVIKLSVDEPTEKFNTTAPTSKDLSDEDYNNDNNDNNESDADSLELREGIPKRKEIKIAASSSTTESIVSTSTESTVSTSTVSTVSTSTASTVSTSTQSTVPTSTESTVSTGSTPSTSTKFATPTTLITSSASTISVTNATTQSTEKSTVTTVATTLTTYFKMRKWRRSNF